MQTRPIQLSSLRTWALKGPSVAVGGELVDAFLPGEPGARPHPPLPPQDVARDPGTTGWASAALLLQRQLQAPGTLEPADRARLASLATGAQGVRAARMARAILNGAIKNRREREELLLGPVPASLRQLQQEVDILLRQPELTLHPSQIEPCLERLEAAPMQADAPAVLVRAARVLPAPWSERCLKLLASWHQAGELKAPPGWPSRVLGGQVAVRGKVLDDSPPLFASADELRRALQAPLPDPRFRDLASDLAARGWMGWNEEQMALVPQALEKLTGMCPDVADERFLREQLQPLRTTPSSKVSWQAFSLMTRLADARPDLDATVADLILDGELRFGLSEASADFLARAAARGWRPNDAQRDQLLSCVELPELKLNESVQYNWEISARALSVLNQLDPEVLDQAQLALPDGTLRPARQSVLERILGSSQFDLGRDLARLSKLAAEVGRAGRIDPTPLVAQLRQTVSQVAPGQLVPLSTEQLTALGLLVGCAEHGVVAAGQLDELLSELLVRPDERLDLGEILDPLRQRLLETGKSRLLNRDLSVSERLAQAESLLDVATCAGARPGQSMPHQEVLDCLELGLRAQEVDQAAWSTVATSAVEGEFKLKMLRILADSVPGPLPGIEPAMQRFEQDYQRYGDVQKMPHEARSRFLLADHLSRRDPAARAALVARVGPDLEAFAGHVRSVGQTYDFVQSSLNLLAGEDYQNRLAALQEPGLSVGEKLARTEHCLKLVGRGQGLLDFQVYPQLQEGWRGQDLSLLPPGPPSLAVIIALTAGEGELTAHQRAVLRPELQRSTPTEHARNSLLEPARRAEYEVCRARLGEHPGREEGLELVRDGVALAQSLPDFKMTIEADQVLTPTPARVELLEAWLGPGLRLEDEQAAGEVLRLLEEGAEPRSVPADLGRILEILGPAGRTEQACDIYREWQALKAPGMDSDRAFEQALRLDLLESRSALPSDLVTSHEGHVQIGAVRVTRRRSQSGQHPAS